MRIHQVRLECQIFTNFGAMGMHAYLTPFQGLLVISFIIWLITLLYVTKKESRYGGGDYGDVLGACFEGIKFLIWSMFLIIVTLLIGYFL